MRLILAPPESSSVSTWSPEPSIRFSKSTPNCWTILWRSNGIKRAPAGYEGRTDTPAASYGQHHPSSSASASQGCASVLPVPSAGVAAARISLLL